MVRHSRGRYTELHLDRCSKLSGAFGHQVDRILRCQMGRHEGHATPSRNRQMSRSEDIRRFVQEFQQDALLAYIPGRQFQGTEVPETDGTLRDPVKLGSHLRSLSEDKDFWASLRT